ncbi:AAA family ATPase [Vibrio splendidus]|uniref:AAA family ATPase n=1 Tax=Vibrio splendidus TaxID=29497 RepID=UPI002468CBC9|nr:AAA family ATPase [Vibrio splendidus]MDH5889767.1 helicase RepA family protein [Vibrio splendidus]
MNIQPKRQYGSLEFSIGSEGFDNNQSWLVKSFFSKSSFGVIYGKSGSRKSFIAIDLSCSIATSTPWQNKTVAAGAVVYVAAEGQTGMARRVRAWEITNGKNVDNLYMLGQSLLLSDASDRRSLIDSIHDIENKHGVKVQLVVLDTLARNFEGDENSSDAMGKFIRGCDTVKEVADTTILCVHHCGKDTSKGVRGSSALIGACDFEFKVTHNVTTNLTTLSNTKQKDAEAAPDFEFDFQAVDLGTVCDENKPITSLALTEPAAIKQEANGENNPVLKALREEFKGQCTRDELRMACFPPQQNIKANTTNQQFKRALSNLQDEGLITIHQKGIKAHASDEIKMSQQYELPLEL